MTAAPPAALTRVGTLDARLAAALIAGDAALRALVGAEPVDRRDRALVLLRIADLHTAPLEVVGDAVRHQGHPAVADLKSRLEASWLAELEVAFEEAGRLADATTPERAVTAMRAVAARDRLPAAYRWLAKEASYGELVEFLALEGGPDGGFDDLVAACQVGLTGSAKLELAQNYWDEMGNGTQEAVHTVLHDRLVAALELPRIPREQLPVEALERAALGGLLATNRWLQPEMIGALGLLELQAGPRCRLVLQALDRVGAPQEAYPFYVEHAEVDPRHGKDWVEKAVGPLVAERPEWGPRIIRGAWWRSTVNLAFFEAVRAGLEQRDVATAAMFPSPYAHAMSGVGVTSEVGRLRTVLLHRPGTELSRLTPRNTADLLFDGVPWVGRAQEEHDAFAQALRDRGVEVLHLSALLQEVLEIAPAREQVIATAIAPTLVGPTLATTLRAWLLDQPSAELAEHLTAGLTHGELPRTGAEGLVARLAGDGDFVVPPLPNLLFTRDSSVWVADHVAVTAPSMRVRRRETSLTGAIYRHHPRFAGTPLLYGGSREEAEFEGGDVLLLAPGVVAVGVGQRTTPAGVEAFALRAFAAGVARTVLAVPIAQERATMHLDTVCTMVDVDAVVMFPAVADTLRAWTVTPDGDGAHVVGPEPFLLAAAKAMGVDELRVVDTGLDPVTAEREQWDDGNNTLALAPGLVVAYERNVVTNAALEAAGIEVVRIAGSELGSGRGGPRCMSCPVLRDPLPA